MSFFDLVLHLDKHLAFLAENYGYWLYVFLFLIIFLETGLVLVPFLPGDSLLFVAGALAANGSIDPIFLSVILISAAILGNTVNFLCGRWFGKQCLSDQSKGFARLIGLIDQRALQKTQIFYQKHGGKTIIAARFIPVVRTFAPFVAGIAQMPQKTFQMFNVAGALLWIISLITGGYFFGNLPLVRDHLHTIVLIGLLSALVPVVLSVLWRIIRSAITSN